jgi:uncharacterized protein YbaP (TraB family)
MLWKLRGTDVYILGTVHRADRPLPLSPAATAALGAADTVAFEANFEFEVDRSLTHYKPTDALSKHIPADLFAATQAAWTERGFAIEDLERSKPASIVFQIADVDCKRRGFEHRLGVDQGVLEFAKRERKKLYFLESTSDGYVPFAKAPASEMEIFLRRTVADPEEGLRDTATLVNAWAADDLEALAGVGARSLRLMPICFGAAIAGRNKAWMKPLTRLILAKRKAVIVVGALHMVGPDNLAELLGRAGHECVWLGNKP